MRGGLPVAGVTLCFVLGQSVVAQGQGFQFVHPPTITAADFVPPHDTKFVWKGPFVQPFSAARCWYAQPSAPKAPIGGTDHWQTVQEFIPTGDVGTVSDYRQQEFHTFSGGGAERGMKEGDMP